MPTVMRIGPFRFFFYSLENNEPPHIHVMHENKTAKYWLENHELVYSKGFNAHELTLLRHIVTEHGQQFMEAWNDHFEG